MFLKQVRPETDDFEDRKKLGCKARKIKKIFQY